MGCIRIVLAREVYEVHKRIGKKQMTWKLFGLSGKIYTTHLIDLQIVPELSIVARNRQLCQLQDEEEQ